MGASDDTFADPPVPDLEAAVRHAVEHDELVVHYQPIVRLDTGAIEGFEALVRWQRPGVGLVPPGEFIAIAEASDLICDLDSWVLRTALGQLATWNDATGSRRLTVAVNISGRHVNAARVVPDVESALSQDGVDPGQLVVEVTETVPIEAAGLEHLRALRELGVVLSLDDFGTGHSSVEQLSRMPIDLVKIDRSFLAVASPAGRALFGSMVEEVRRRELPVVAEGVESLDQLALLRDLDVAFAQGNALGVPMPAEDLGEVPGGLARGLDDKP